MARQGNSQAGSATTTAQPMTTSMAVLAAADAGRLAMTILNDTAVVLEVHASLGSTAAIVKLAAGASYEVPEEAAGLAFWGKLASGTGNANVTAYK